MEYASLIARAVELGREGDHLTARRLASEAIALDPNSRQAYRLGATLSWQLGDMPAAEAMCRSIVSLDPEDADALNSLALCCLAQHKRPEAVQLLERAIRLQPGRHAFLYNLGLAQLQANNLRLALKALEEALRLKPDSSATLELLAEAYTAAGDVTAARHLNAIYNLNSDSPAGHIARARALLIADGDLEEAEDHARSAIASQPGNALAHLALGMALVRLGRIGEANLALRAAIAHEPERAAPYWHLVQAIRVTEIDRPLVEKMVSLAKDPDRSTDERRCLEFSIGKALDDLGEYETAMKHFDTANALSRTLQLTPFNLTHYRRFVDSIIRSNGTCRPPTFQETSVAPIIIVGMMRSGTTLLEQIVSAHPKVSGAGELRYWSEVGPTTLLNELSDTRAQEIAEDYKELLARVGGDGMRVTDKMPDNYRWVGLIHKLFPEARILFCLRNAADTCLSSYMTLLSEHSPYTNDPTNLIAVYQEHVRLMELWSETIPADRFRIVHYEDLVLDREQTTRDVIAFCDLPWDDVCLHPELNSRDVRTASQWQVRQPVYTRSIERWRNYKDCLGGFAKLIDLY